MTKQQLIEDNMGLVYFVIRTNFPSYIGDEDIVQAGMLGLCYAANSHNEEKSEFSTYAYRAIRGFICKEFRARNKAKNSGAEVVSLDCKVSKDDEDSATLGDLIVGESDVELVDVNEMFGELSPLDTQIMQLREQGYNNVQIAKIVGRSNERIGQRLRRLKRIYDKKSGGTDG